jgi:fatty acid desaturase
MGGISIILPMVALGCLFAHAVELQHQCLHYTAYRSKAANRIVGFFLGIPLFVSFSDYQRSHMFHHRMLGRPENHEFFEYDHASLKRFGGMLSYMFMLQHYRQKAMVIFKALTTRERSADPADRRITAEYRVIGIFFLAACAVSVLARTPMVLTCWILPLLVALPVHALIELPEHVGCDVTTTDIFRNTRTIRASWLAVWFTNGNNFHVEHHYLPSAPIDRLAKLHQVVHPRIVHLDDSYWTSYNRIFRSSATPQTDRADRNDDSLQGPPEDLATNCDVKDVAS